MSDFLSWVVANVEWFALFVAALLLLFDWIDAFAGFLWHALVKRKSPIGEQITSGRPSVEYLGPFTFRLYTTKFDICPIEGWGSERPYSWFILVRETFASRIRRRFTLTKSPEEMDFVEVAHRRIVPPQDGHIASYATIESRTIIMRRIGFIRVVINTNRESLCPGTRVQLKSGDTVVRMSTRYLNDDNIPDSETSSGS